MDLALIDQSDIGREGDETTPLAVTSDSLERIRLAPPNHWYSTASFYFQMASHRITLAHWDNGISHEDA